MGCAIDRKQMQMADEVAWCREGGETTKDERQEERREGGTLLVASRMALDESRMECRYRAAGHAVCRVSQKLHQTERGREGDR